MPNMRNRGVTLIELMVVVVIVSIIAAVAYPSYSNYMRQTRRADAQMALTRIAAMQEKFYSDCGGYYAKTLNGPVKACGSGPDQADAVLGLPNTLSPDGHYSLSIAFGNTLLSCQAAGPPPGQCNGLAGPPLSQCLARCAFTLVADPDTGGTTQRQAGNGKLRLDSLGIKQWDKANNNSYSAKWTDK